MADLIIDGLNYGPDASDYYTPAASFPDLSAWSAPVSGQVQSPAFVDTTPAPRTTSAGAVDFGAWLTGTASKVTDYLIAKDAASHQITAVRSPNGATVGYTQAGLTIPAPSGNVGPLLLIAGAVVVGVLVAKKG